MHRSQKFCAQIIEQRNRGGAVLLISQDVDEITELADRVVVMSEGRIVYETPVQAADQRSIARAAGEARISSSPSTRS